MDPIGTTPEVAEVKARGRKASNQPSLLTFQAALRSDEPLPAWIDYKPGALNPETRRSLPGKYVTPVVLRIVGDGQNVEAVRFVAEEHRAATVEIVGSVPAAEFVAWIEKRNKDAHKAPKATSAQ